MIKKIFKLKYYFILNFIIFRFFHINIQEIKRKLKDKEYMIKLIEEINNTIRFYPLQSFKKDNRGNKKYSINLTHLSRNDLIDLLNKLLKLKDILNSYINRYNIILTEKPILFKEDINKKICTIKKLLNKSNKER